MFINEGIVKVELDFSECWNIGRAILSSTMKEDTIGHWSNHGYSKYLENHSNEIKMARQFCGFFKL